MLSNSLQINTKSKRIFSSKINQKAHVHVYIEAHFLYRRRWSLINTRICCWVNESVEKFFLISRTHMHMNIRTASFFRPPAIISSWDSLEIYVDDWWSELWLWWKINYGHGLCGERKKASEIWFDYFLLCCLLRVVMVECREARDVVKIWLSKLGHK